MAFTTHANYSIASENRLEFNRNYGSFRSYRNALIKTSEHDKLFLLELGGKDVSSYMRPHYDGSKSSAIVYGNYVK